MNTRSNLAEQLREYQIPPKHEWSSLSFTSSSSSSTPSSNNNASRVDDVLYVTWELLIFAFLVFSGISLYFRHMRLAFLLICITTFLLVGMKIAKQVRKDRKNKRRMLLPLSM